MTDSPPDAVERAALDANAAFYRAFEHLDIEAMEAVWSRVEPVLCVHPGWTPLLGVGPILASWRAIFRGTGYMEVEFEVMAVDVQPGLAWVHGVERVRQAGRAGEARGEVAATNLVRLDPEGWRIAVHHASPIAR